MFWACAVKAVEDDECELSSFELQFSPVVTTPNLINQVSVSVKRAWTKSMRTSSDPLFRLRFGWENYWYEKAGVNFGQVRISCTSEQGTLVITEIISVAEMDSSKSPTQGNEKTLPGRPAIITQYFVLSSSTKMDGKTVDLEKYEQIIDLPSKTQGHTVVVLPI
ncbi:hypothetical protein MTR67_010145, partial [Solanum verrucosum]